MQTIRGWLSGQKSDNILASDNGWFELFTPDGKKFNLNKAAGRVPVSLKGIQEGQRFIVYETLSVGAETKKRPYFAIHPPTMVFNASKARLAVDEHMSKIGFPQVMLPALWFKSREYGEEELLASHSRLSQDLFLLQSPEFPMYAALAEGIGRFYCWGRSFRFEPKQSAKYLMEFEQIDIGISHSSLDEIMMIVEDIVKIVAKSVGVEISHGNFDRSSPSTNEASSIGSNLFSLQLSEDIPEQVIGIIKQRLDAIKVRYWIADRPKPCLMIECENDNLVDVQSTIDSFNKIVNGNINSQVIKPFWVTPLPTQDIDLTMPTKDLQGLTSARFSREGRQYCEEAELYVNDIEIAHAGVFASHDAFIDNLAKTNIPISRYDWLLESLKNAPPQMAKVGIGWERLLSALYGVQDASAFQLYPRSGSGELTHKFEENGK